MAATREIFCQDALVWLPTQKNLDSIVTSIPEMDEVGMNMADYLPFLRAAARACFAAVKDSGYAVFLQTDRKHRGHWVDKSYHISAAAEEAGFRMVWHKIALRTDVGKTGLFRPTYGHMLCYTKTGLVGKPFPDVLGRGAITYRNAFGRDAVHRVCEYLKAQGISTVVDPFVGSGTTLAAANELGLHAIGVDIDPAQCAKALTLPPRPAP